MWIDKENLRMLVEMIDLERRRFLLVLVDQLSRQGQWGCNHWHLCQKSAVRFLQSHYNIHFEMLLGMLMVRRQM